MKLITEQAGADMTSQLKAELAMWTERLADARRSQWADGIAQCGSRVRRIRRQLGK